MRTTRCFLIALTCLFLMSCGTYKGPGVPRSGVGLLPEALGIMEHGNFVKPAADAPRLGTWKKSANGELVYMPPTGPTSTGVAPGAGPVIGPGPGMGMGVGLLSYLPGVGGGIGATVAALGILRFIASRTQNKIDDAVSRGLDQGARDLGLPLDMSIKRPPGRGVA